MTEKMGRKGFSCFRWPKAYLAAIYAVFERTEGSARQKAELVREYLPEVEAEYLETTGRELNDNTIANRFDKAIRYGEVRSYEHLLDGARESVGRWLAERGEEAETEQPPADVDVEAQVEPISYIQTEQDQAA